MSTSAVASQTLALARVASTGRLWRSVPRPSALTDSRQLVVLNERPSTAADAESVQGQGLVQALRQTAGGRLVPVVQLAVELLEGRQGLGVRRAVVGSSWRRRRQSPCSLLGR